MRRKYMEEVTLGTEGGGWDNDEYLESIHNEGPGTSNEELLYQAIAYTKMLAENRMKPKPEYKKIIDDLRSQMSEDEQRHVEERFAAEAAGLRAPVAPVASTPQPAAPPLPDKDPRDLRLQYKAYLQTCDRQNREPALEILTMIHRLYNEKPPQPREAEELAEIVQLERRFNLVIHSG
ncbi:hypothetical protein Ctob_009188, partial [Chrysochromulina tobinii]